MSQQRIKCEKLTRGYEFTPTKCILDSKLVMCYLKATEDNNPFYEVENIVPPMVIAALTMAAMSTKVELPAGTVQVSQDLKFNNIVNINEILTSHARVNQIVDRGKFHMLTIGIKVENPKNTTVMTGETSFILPSVR